MMVYNGNGYGDNDLLYPGMAEPSVIAQLDGLYLFLAALTLVHAIRKQGVGKGTAILVYLVVHTVVFEHASLFLGGTIVTPGLLFFRELPRAPRSTLFCSTSHHPLALPFFVGLLQFGFGAVYEMQGPLNGFWSWPRVGVLNNDDAWNGVIAHHTQELQAWEDYPPFAFLQTAKLNREIATITSDGVFIVSKHAQHALTERLYGFPVLAPYFHFAFGFAWAVGLLLTGPVHSNNKVSLVRWIVAGFSSVFFFLPPIWITWGLTSVVGVPLYVGVVVSLAVSIVPILVFGRRVPTEVASEVMVPLSSSPATASNKKDNDLLLFLISLVMHAFMVSFPWRKATPTPIGLIVLVSATSLAHLIAQYICCFRYNCDATAVISTSDPRPKRKQT
eukprot:CAMPEP_0170968468 /NCGR_PEP_ID=MMETSP0735-20130129/43297_1 /TAXON_ID=186038 /ORGANISM="Fragilariopsis kerguelensis, Strain L26-C5" /LENGTH=388 /DNA_ID=CAMNT_0011387545 /DNA_START=63 /DNA_END=1230 /DNA_ORIENTATION=+